MDNETYKTLQKGVAVAARAVAHSWPGVVDQDDVEQGIWFRLIEAGGNTQNKLVEMDEAMRVRSLTQVGHQLAAKERDDYEYFSGNAMYGTDMVREFLKAGVFDFLTHDGRDSWSFDEESIRRMRFLQRPDSVSVTAMIDLTIALKTLFDEDSGHAAAIVNRYKYQIKPDTPNARRQLSRAVDALTRGMNSINRRRRAEYTEGPGIRQVVSNSKAQSMVSRVWNGDGSEGRR